jgi:hypothetical protein
MFGHKHYVPVLKGKRAEFPSLRELRSRDGLTPLFESVPNQSADYVPARMASVWERHRPYFIDMLFLDDEDMTEANAEQHPLRVCFNDVRNRLQTAIPVTGTGRSPAYQAALRLIVAEQQRGYAIRLVPDDFEDEDQLPASLNALVNYIGIQKASIDIMIDSGSVAGIATPVISRTHRAELEMLPNIADWRTVTVIAGAFPMSLAPLTRNIWNPVARNDWHAWVSLLTRPITRLPSYGDYAIAHPNLPPTGRATILAQLRYTTVDSFMIYKGSDVFDHPTGFEQFLDICRDTIHQQWYSGQTFSFGDAEIHARATTGGSSGNAETWRQIGTNHHIEMVKRQIASLP